ncbi:DUF5816 domain-containing protein [Halocatena halophila]|uniref:DUF5816 domain-containing protein n=1 Tax=Halocatena halophila TaxID=2814576 RepID=UPI002ED00862
MHKQRHPDGTTLFIDRSMGERGSKAPFYVVFGPDPDDRWGFYCGNCDSFATAVDAMGRIKCTDCGNVHKAEQWDAAHE